MEALKHASPTELHETIVGLGHANLVVYLVPQIVLQNIPCFIGRAYPHWLLIPDMTPPRPFFHISILDDRRSGRDGQVPILLAWAKVSKVFPKEVRTARDYSECRVILW